MEEYKLEEQRRYDEIYKKSTSIIDISLKNSLLRESEERFALLLEKYCTSGTMVLELGCGAAPATLPFRQSASGILLADISLEALKSIFNSGFLDETVLHASQMDAEFLAFKSASFDCVVDNEFFSSIDIERVLHEIARVLKPGGVLICKETFGSNPVFSLRRKAKVRRGQMHAWVAEHVFRLCHLQGFSDIFIMKNIEYFHLFSVLFAPMLQRLPDRGVGSVVHRAVRLVDSVILSIPFVRFLAFKVVFVLERR